MNKTKKVIFFAAPSIWSAKNAFDNMLGYCNDLHIILDCNRDAGVIATYGAIIYFYALDRHCPGDFIGKKYDAAFYFEPEYRDILGENEYNRIGVMETLKKFNGIGL